jgi:hypothetical protein
MTSMIKIALIGALLASTISAASAQNVDPHDQKLTPLYGQQWNAPENEVNKSNVGEGGGGA